MSKRKLFKNKSLYSIRRHHVDTSKGAVFENDYVTIAQNDGYFNDIPLYPESNFKFYVKSNRNGKKRHVKNAWVMNGDSNIWTQSSLSGYTSSNEDNKIVLKPNYSSLNDFAYFGSAVELIKTTVNNIITNFPGGLCYYGADAPKMKINGVDYYLISNEGQIDCWSKDVTSINHYDNPLKCLSYSFNSYTDASGNSITSPIINITGSCIDSIIGNVTINNTTFYIYKDENGINQLVSNSSNILSQNGIIIKPKDEYVFKFWNNLNDFEKILLNKNSIPSYTAIFNAPQEDENGFLYYTPKYYTWPIVNNTPFLDFSSGDFHRYIDSLNELAIFHDNYDADNMWRMMTHESIKNLDTTFYVDENNEINFSRIEDLIHIQGRQFDDIKRYADGIKTFNNISYNEQNNVPDYFLSDINESKGWVTQNVCDKNFNLTEDIVMSDDSGNTIATLITSGKTSGYINSSFARRLALCSDYIQSMKGTKKGMETLLGLFGYNIYGNNPDITITEYYAQVEDLLNFDDFTCYRAEFDYVNEGENSDFLWEYPLALYEIIEDGQTVSKIGPWYDSKKTYPEGFYYQSKGGWGKFKEKNVNRPDITTVSSITDNYIYKETELYMLFVENLDELIALPHNKINEDVICYVFDITGIEGRYNVKDCSGNTNDICDEFIINNNEKDFSHYFVLKNKILSNKLGWVNNEIYNGCYGWYNIKEHEFNGIESPSEYGKKILYLETLIPKSEGNNTHTGKGNYDFGYDYLDKYKYLFREAIRDGMCDNLSTVKYNEIANFGFVIDLYSTTSGKTFSCVNDEEESLKRINLKNVTVRFNKVNTEEEKNYIKNIVIPYLENMIPSTMIVEYLFGNEESYMTIMASLLNNE